MKKILTAIVLFALVVLPMSVMAMTSISEDELSSVTGQAGVSIGADLTMNLSLGAVAWGDIDGLVNDDVSTTAGGWVGIQNLSIQNLRIHMRTDDGMADPTLIPALMAEYPGMTAVEAGLLTVLTTQELLTIDIYTGTAQGPVLGKTAVRIGLPTFEITMNDLTLNAALFANTADDTPDLLNPESLGQIFIGGVKVLLGKGNYVDISQNETNSGVLIHIANDRLVADSEGRLPTDVDYETTYGNLIDSVSFDALSWGDLDGLNADFTAAQIAAFELAATLPPGTLTDPVIDAMAAGFIGIRGMDLSIKMDMYMSINVGTATGIAVPTLLNDLMTTGDVEAFKDDLIAQLDVNDPVMKDSLAYMLWNAGIISRTSVDIALQGSVGITEMASQVVLANNAGLVGTMDGLVLSPTATAYAGILGNFYISGLQLTIPNGGTGTVPQSWVSISAH